MDAKSLHEQREHDLAMHVFTVSAGMVGVCLTGIGILRLVASQSRVQTFGDDLLAVDAILFVLTCGLAFWSFKTSDGRIRRRLRSVCDTCFFAGLTAMAGICALIAYTVL